MEQAILSRVEVREGPKIEARMEMYTIGVLQRLIKKNTYDKAKYVRTLT